MAKKEELIELLIKNKKIDKNAVEEALKAVKLSKNSLEEVLIERGLLTNEDIIEAKAEIFNMPYISLVDKEVPNNVLATIPKEVSENYKIVCFDKEEDEIKVGLTDPENLKAIEAISFLAKEENLQVKFYLISEESFNTIFNQYQSFQQEIYSALETKAKEEEEELSKIDLGQKEEVLEEVVKTAPITKIVSVIIRHAVEGRASDIHIEPFQKESRVRYRIDGVLHTSLLLPRSVHNAVVARIKVMSKLKLDETRLPQDGRISLVINNRNIDFRVSIMPLLGTEKAVLRILDVTKGAPTLEELGYSGRALRVVHENIKKSNGMFLVTGPTGSGKSTTLFSIMNVINTEGVNISTLEDPVEYFIKGVNQSQTRPEIGFDFANGLRSLLRQDPDVIMVGEIRDNETAELAIHAGLTGHFVLSTLHTNTALGAIPRLMDMKVEAFLLGSTLNIVVAQRLTRKICKYCKEEVKLPEDIIDDIKNELKQIPDIVINQEIENLDIENLTFFKGKGCHRCGDSGYSGRIAIIEVINVSDKLKEIIVDEKRMLKMKDVKDDQGFITMKQDGIIKVIKGLTTMEEVLRVIRL